MGTRQLFGDDLFLEQYKIRSECQLYVLRYCKRNL